MKEITDLSNLKVPPGLDTIDRIAAGYKAYQVLATAVDKGLFDWMEKHRNSTRDEIAKAMGINGMFIRSYLQALVDMGLLACKNDRFSNTKLATGFLVGSQPFYQGECLRVLSGDGSWWNNLSSTLIQDKPGSDDFYKGPSKEFIRSLAGRSIRGELQAVTGTIEAWKGFGKSKKALDLGGGHGLYAIALCQANPSLEAVVFDKPHVIGVTGEYVKRYALGDRISVQSGDMIKDDLGSGFDIVVISHVLYKFRKDLPAIFDKVAGSLNSGGLLVSNHWFCSPGCGTSPGGLQELDKSLSSFGHPLCHPEEFSGSLEKSGFDLLSVTDVPSVHGISTLHMAVKGKSGRGAKPKKSKGCGCGCD